MTSFSGRNIRLKRNFSEVFKESYPELFQESEESEESEEGYGRDILPLSTLPKNHKPARGRKRSIQLRQMTKEQIEEEKFIRLEKNRLAAKGCRSKKKKKLEEMEEKIKYMKTMLSSKKIPSDLIKTLEEKNRKIDILQEVVQNQSATIKRMLEEKNYLDNQ